MAAVEEMTRRRVLLQSEIAYHQAQRLCVLPVPSGLVFAAAPPR